jgi:hypothetical protein
MKIVFSFLVLISLTNGFTVLAAEIKNDAASDVNLSINNLGAVSSSNSPPMFITSGESFNVTDSLTCPCEALQGEINAPNLNRVCEPSDLEGNTCDEPIK